MKCTLKYNAGKWFCSCEDLFEPLKAYGNKPDPTLEMAITEFHRRYYPDEAHDSKKHPWKIHAAVDNISDLKKNVVEHELTWHWRLLLPCLRSPLPSSNSIVLCVSQIRQWQLVSCFQMEWPSGETCKELLASIRSAKKNLLRQPVFGKSHRITSWEVYASFYSCKVLEEIKTAVKDAKDNTFRLAHILGRYDTYIKIANPTWNDSEKCYEMDIEQAIDLDPEHEPAIIEKLPTDDVCRPYGLVRLPQFKEIDDNELPEQKPLLFSSDNYCRAFEQVSDVLNDPSARQVLLIAPPGSGKEYLSEIFHTCRKKKWLFDKNFSRRIG